MTTLTDHECQFMEHMAVFDSPVDAYQQCGAARPGTKRVSLQQSAYRMLARPHVRAAITARRNALAEQGPTAARAALVNDLQAMVDCDVREIVSMTSHHCPACYSTPAYAESWAINAALALDQGAPAPPRPMASDSFDPEREPWAACPACRGAGVPVARFASFSTLSPPARRLLRGVELFPDGSVKRVLLADQSQLRLELHKATPGFHVPTTSVTLNLNAHSSLKRGMSVEEALGVLETIAPTAPIAQLVAANPDPTVVSTQ